MISLALIALATTWVWRAGRTGPERAFAVAAGLLVFLPGSLRVEVPGAWPEVTVHRVLLGVLALTVWRHRPAAPVGLPLVTIGWLFGALVMSRLASTLVSVTPTPSAKELLSFLLETVLFYQLGLLALRRAAALCSVLRAVGLALAAVAAVAVVERYAGLSLPELLLPHFEHCRNGVQSTYPHRILLGYAMAMGLPLTLELVARAPSRAGRFGWVLASGLLVLTCFLADSRGGWLGMGVAGFLSVLLGSGPARRIGLVLGVVALGALALRPGVRDTILARAQATYAADSVKGASYRYRWRLWEVAYAEIARRPERMALGYGAQSTEAMDLSRYFRPQEGGSTTKIGFTSWDNHYASNLIEFGFLGLAIELLGWAALGVLLLRARARRTGEARALLTVAVVALAVFVFARTNVYIFGEQPKFLFWTLVLLGAAASREPLRARRVGSPPTPAPLPP